MKNETKELTKSQSAAYQKLHKIIKAGASTFMEVGMALVTMHNERLYRRDFSTFEEFTKSCGISRAHAYRLMGAVQTTLAIENVSLGDKPKAAKDKKNGAKTVKNLLVGLSIKARDELGKYPSNKQDEILNAASLNGTPTETEIAAAAVRISIGRKHPRKDKGSSVNMAEQIEADRTNANASELDRRIQAAELANPVLPPNMGFVGDPKAVVMVAQFGLPAEPRGCSIELRSSRQFGLPGEAPSASTPASAINTVADALAFCRTTDQPGGDWETAAMLLAPEIDRLNNLLRQATENAESMMAKSDLLAGKKTLTPDQLLSEVSKLKRFIPDDLPQIQREQYGIRLNELVKWLMNPVQSKAFSAYTSH